MTTNPNRRLPAPWLITAFFLLAFSSALHAQFEWVANQGAVTITRYTGSDAVVVIPDTVEGRPVTAIGDKAFYDPFSFASLTSVTIPNTVTNIGTNAFGNCSGLTNVTFGTGLLALGDSAFSSCSGLTSVTLPDNLTWLGGAAFYACGSLTNATLGSALTYIGSAAFEDCALSSIAIPSRVSSIEFGAFYCASLTNITVDPANPFFASWEGVLFDKTLTMLLSCPRAKAGRYSAPVGVKRIGNTAFAWCDSLTSVALPEGLTNIADYAFDQCASLTAVTLPDGLATIGKMAFYQCASLSNAVMPKGLTTVGLGAFSGCALTHLTIPSSLSAIGEWALSECGLTNITVDPANPLFASLDGVLFDKALTTLVQYPDGKAGSYTIPATVTRIGVGAFAYSYGLTNVFVPGSVTRIEDFAFARSTLGYEHAFRAFFLGDAPKLGYAVFSETWGNGYYLPGATGWPIKDDNFSFSLWEVRATSPRLLTNCFAFTLSGTPWVPVSIEVSTNALTGPWQLLQTCTLIPSSPNNSAIEIVDPVPTNAPARFYRFRFP